MHTPEVYTLHRISPEEREKPRIFCGFPMLKNAYIWAKNFLKKFFIVNFLCIEFSHLLIFLTRSHNDIKKVLIFLGFFDYCITPEAYAYSV